MADATAVTLARWPYRGSSAIPLPELTSSGDLPPEIHRATPAQTLARFGAGSSRRVALGLRLERVYRLAQADGQLARLVVFGSFVTAEPEPNDVDVFLLMEDTFDVGRLDAEARLLFDHATAQAHLGVSAFWLRRSTAFEGEQATIAYWQTKRDGTRRRIVELVSEVP